MQRRTNILAHRIAIKPGSILACTRSQEQWVVTNQLSTGKLKDQYGQYIFGCKSMTRSDECVVFIAQLGTRYHVVGMMPQASTAS
jgi:hypothetical protein